LASVSLEESSLLLPCTYSSIGGHNYGSDRIDRFPSVGLLNCVRRARQVARSSAPKNYPER
jgi:hypothetical protein